MERSPGRGLGVNVWRGLTAGNRVSDQQALGRRKGCAGERRDHYRSWAGPYAVHKCCCAGREIHGQPNDRTRDEHQPESPG